MPPRHGAVDDRVTVLARLATTHQARRGDGELLSKRGG